MKKRLLLRFVLLMVLGLGGFILLAWWTAPTNLTSMNHFEKIAGGMSIEQVEDGLGSPGKDGTGSFLLNSKNASDIVAISFAGKGVPMQAWKEWQTPDGRGIVVMFHESGHVATAINYTRTPSLLERIRRWLRMSG